MKFLRQIGFALAILVPLPVAAYPDGAPWGSADSASPQSCASCHFDGDAVPDSDAISMVFGSDVITLGEQVDIQLQFKNPENKKVGFQIIAMMGVIETDDEDVEVNGGSARSVQSRDNLSWANVVNTDVNTDTTVWNLHWVTPENPLEEIVFWIAVNESNNDQSAFGDRIHFKRVQVSINNNRLLLPALR